MYTCILRHGEYIQCFTSPNQPTTAPCTRQEQPFHDGILGGHMGTVGVDLILTHIPHPLIVETRNNGALVQH